MTTVVIVDDHEGFRSWARRLLEADGFDVVAEAHDGPTALDAVEDEKPDLVLLDVQLPDLDGFEIADRISATGTPTRIVLVSSRDRTAHPDRLSNTGAVGFLTKSELTPQRIRALLTER